VLQLLDATNALRREAEASARVVTDLQRRLAADSAAATAAASSLAERVDKAERETRDARKEAGSARDEARRAKDDAKSARDAVAALERQVKELTTWKQQAIAAAAKR